MGLTASTAPLGILTASTAAGIAVAGLLDEAAQPILDEAAQPILDESGS